LRSGTVEAERREVQYVHEHVADSDRVVLTDVVIDAFGKQCDLLAVIAFNEGVS
jgi:hypothetical protein